MKTRQWHFICTADDCPVGLENSTAEGYIELWFDPVFEPNYCPVCGEYLKKEQISIKDSQEK